MQIDIYIYVQRHACLNVNMCSYQKYNFMLVWTTFLWKIRLYPASSWDLSRAMDVKYHFHQGIRDVGRESMFDKWIISDIQAKYMICDMY